MGLLLITPGSPSHLYAAKEELEKEWQNRHGSAVEDTKVTGPKEDPTISTTLETSSSETKPNGSPQPSGREDGEGEELVVVIAGGMTSQLTYDGIDVCASRVAWEVGMKIVDWGNC